MAQLLMRDGYRSVDDPSRANVLIVNTCGWDTDCNSGNLGCLMGIRNGLAGFTGGPDWRGPVMAMTGKPRLNLRMGSMA